ncbi:MAG: DegT/DnrJ/EryC1/StrS family aminotransferase [Bacilli bacterium]|nr:DegT/DnrJ/EryC1/StrS family aminotransferase [Bacilli bacterium]
MKRINVTQSSLPSYEKYIEKIRSLWDTKFLTNMGVFHMELEKKLIEYLKTPYISLYSNGHIALEYALESLERKGEVITTPFTFVSTTHAIVRTGNIPIFCDIKESDYTIDETKIESLITDKTIAILPVHVYGNVCNVEEIEKIAQKHNLKVVYDAAHAFGVKYKGKGIATYGDISMFSFHATKVFHTGEGGALTYNNIALKQKFEVLKNFGIISQEEVSYVGGNAKLDEFRAAMGLCNLEIADEEISKRKAVFERYEENLKGIKGIKLNLRQPEVVQNYAYFPVLFDNYKLTRDQVFILLKENEIYARKYFYPLTSSFKAYSNLFEMQETLVALKITDNILCLPMYANLEISDVDRICDIIKEGESKI